MAFSFKKNIVVGVSVSPDMGLEIAQVDFEHKVLLKYGCKQLAYDVNRKEIADLDLFKETLSDLLTELQIPKDSDIVLNLPNVAFKVNEYPAALDAGQVTNAIEEELLDHPIFGQEDACISAVYLPNSTMQFNKVAYTALQKTMLIEMAMQIQSLGYNVVGIDTSINSTLNALIYNARVNVDPTKNWVLLLVENNYCRIIPMQGRNYVDYFEERIAIGEVLGDDENYRTVVDAVNPIIKNIPSEYLYVVSKTNVINAESLAEKLTYKAQIVHMEANVYAKEAFIDTAPNIDPNLSKFVTTEVIGAAINSEFKKYSSAKFNLFNEDLGDVYKLSQPPVIRFRSLELVLSVQNMIVASIFVGAILIALSIVAYFYVVQQSAVQEEKNAAIVTEIETAQAYLKQNENVSTEMFDEGDEINIGLGQNKNVYSYYTIVGTEIPKKLWLTRLVFGNHTVIEGQADNLESIYGFYRNIKDYDSSSDIKLQKLGLATKSKVSSINSEEKFDTDSILSSLDADYYQFRISDTMDDPKPVSKDGKDANNDGQNSGGNSVLPPNLEPVE